ncbi:glycosyltransferase family 2 protein [Plantactinospora sp. GCM10030261]|uniref:glycosyltransferase family 2 protein n=1 Tax=Plantactinospora sp. GCM10030261 TaxID=3273420 RepID=UPI0036082F1B
MNETTVVVATRNRRDRLLEALGRCDAPVIVVDNGSTDGTPDAVRARFPEVRVVPLTRNTGAAARNIGVELARTPFVAFADDDSYWAPGALARAAELMRAYPSTGLLAARVLVGAEERLDPVSRSMAAAPLGDGPDQPGPSVLGFLACSVVVRRVAFRAVGGFDPVLRVYGEEALFALDLAAAGWRLAYVPELVVHHFPERAGRDRSARQRMETRNRLLTALLRRPAAVVARTALAALRDPAGRPGVWAAARELGWAIRHRRRLPAEVEAARARLDRWDAEPAFAAGDQRVAL